MYMRGRGRGEQKIAGKWDDDPSAAGQHRAKQNLIESNRSHPGDFSLGMT